MRRILWGRESESRRRCLGSKVHLFTTIHTCNHHILTTYSLDGTVRLLGANQNGSSRVQLRSVPGAGSF